MDKLIELYGQMKKLRENGVRVKDISEETDIASSVLSSLYSTVLPLYAKMISEGEEEESAIEKALQQVNNISRRKLSVCIDELFDKIPKIEPKNFRNANGEKAFFDDMEKEAAKYIGNANAYSGLYIGYSASSFCDGLKAEPYMISRINEGENMPKVYSQNMQGDYYTGIGIFSPFQIGYMMFNEQKRLQLALKVIYLQLPIMEYPGIIKGIYLTHDYSRNPIARRIILVRQSDEIPLDEFADLKTEVIGRENISGPLEAYYEYTCGKQDCIKSLMLVSPERDIESLKKEKLLLEYL